MVQHGQTIAVWFSCGVSSAVAAKKTIELYGDIATIRVINNPVIEEHPDNIRFRYDVEKWINRPIELAINLKYPNCSAVEIWENVRFMSGNMGAPCTLKLKKEARQQWENNNPADWIVMGFTAEEKHRNDRFIKFERANLLPVLINANLTKNDCFSIVRNAGIKLPAIYGLGYPNANCIGCVKATSPTYWNHVRKMHPEVFQQRAIQSRKIGARLVRVKNKRIFLDELSADAKGNSMKSIKLSCSIFCEL